MKHTTVLLSVALVLVPVLANAACVQADLAGTWQTYSVVPSNWIRCRIDVAASSGVAIDASCYSAAGQPIHLLSGQLVISDPSACKFTANFAFSGGAKYRVEHGTLAADGLTGNGVGLLPRGSIIFSMTKLLDSDDRDDRAPARR